MTTPKCLQTIQDDIVQLGWIASGEVAFHIFPPDDDDPAWHLYAFPHAQDGVRSSKAFSLELTLITERLDTVTSILFDTGTENNAPPSVRIRGVMGKTPVMVCILERPVEFEKEPARGATTDFLIIPASVSAEI